MFANLEEIIRQYIPLTARPNSRGWYPVLCKVCNDHGRKGKRGGFNFEGTKVGYNCFNCGAAAVFDPTESKTLSKDMREILDAFSVPKEEYQKVMLSALAFQQTGEKPQPPIREIEPPEITLPDLFYPLIDDPNDEWAVCANEHLWEHRRITCKDYPFYLCKKNDSQIYKSWYGRLIIPLYKQDKLVFYQGRDLTETRSTKYLSHHTERDNVLYGYEHILQNTDTPLYIVEGFFDAFVLKGVAVLGSKISPNQLRWINQTRRQKVVIPDRYGDGVRLAEQALELGWNISTPDIGSCKDVSEAVVKYGLLYTLKTIKDSTSSGFEAATNVNLYCKK